MNSSAEVVSKPCSLRYNRYDRVCRFCGPCGLSGGSRRRYYYENITNDTNLPQGRRDELHSTVFNLIFHNARNIVLSSADLHGSPVRKLTLLHNSLQIPTKDIQVIFNYSIILLVVRVSGGVFPPFVQSALPLLNIMSQAFKLRSTNMMYVADMVVNHFAAVVDAYTRRYFLND